MTSKRKLLEKSRLYLIIDKELLGRRPLIKTARLIYNSGVDIIQLRDKEPAKPKIFESASRISALLKKSKTIFIINDYPDIAKITDSDGVHLGQGDFSVKIARRIVGKDKLIGVSCHNLKQAIRAQKEGADYVGLGPIFATSTKPKDRPIGLKLIGDFQRKLDIPFFVLGGINIKNIKQVLDLGIKRIAVCSAILQAQNIPATINRFYKILA